MRKISVLLSEPEEARFCAYCKQTGHKKSTLIAHLIKEHLDKEHCPTEAATPQEPGASRAARKFSGRASPRLRRQRGMAIQRGKP